MKIKNKLESLFGDNTMISIKNGQVAKIDGLIKTANEGTKAVVRYTIRKMQYNRNIQRRRPLKDGLYVLTVEVKGLHFYSSLKKVF